METIFAGRPDLLADFKKFHPEIDKSPSMRPANSSDTLNVVDESTPLLVTATSTSDPEMQVVVQRHSTGRIVGYVFAVVVVGLLVAVGVVAKFFPEVLKTVWDPLQL
jgi:hypothetical protein